MFCFGLKKVNLVVQTHGFEMMCARHSGKDMSDIQHVSDDSVQNNIRWVRFLSSLQGKGYFKVIFDGVFERFYF